MGRGADFLELTKPRITLLVTLTTAAGFALASLGPLDPGLLARTLVGTALVAAGSATFNMVIERRLDLLMRRTANRPLPAGRMGTGLAVGFGLALSSAGLDHPRHRHDDVDTAGVLGAAGPRRRSC